MVTTMPQLNKEVEFKAAFYQDRSVSARAKRGHHLPKQHNTPYVVAPQLRPDGKTYCDTCDPSLVDYEHLTDAEKQPYREMVKTAMEAEIAWRESQKAARK